MNILVEMSMAFQVYEHLVECLFFHAKLWWLFIIRHNSNIISCHIKNAYISLTFGVKKFTFLELTIFQRWKAVSTCRDFDALLFWTSVNDKMSLDWVSSSSSSSRRHNDIACNKDKKQYSKVKWSKSHLSDMECYSNAEWVEGGNITPQNNNHNDNDIVLASFLSRSFFILAMYII